MYCEVLVVFCFVFVFVLFLFLFLFLVLIKNLASTTNSVSAVPIMDRTPILADFTKAVQAAFRPSTSELDSDARKAKK